MKEVAEAAAAPPPPSTATAATGVRPPERRLFMLNRLVETILHAPERRAAHARLPPARPCPCAFRTTTE